MSKVTKVVATLSTVAALGVAMLPLSSYAADPSASLSLSATVKDTLSIQVKGNGASDEFGASGTVTFEDLVNDTDATNAGDTNIAVAQMLVKSNNKKGYKVTSTGHDTALQVEGDAERKIEAGNPEQKTTSAWGYKVAKASGTTSNDINIQKSAYNSSLTEGVIVSRSSAADATGDTYDLTFGVSVASNQAAGIYAGSITLTASNNS